MEEKQRKTLDIPLISGMRKQFFKLGESSIDSGRSNNKNYLGKMTAGIVNLAFACELCLKELYFKTSQNLIKGHDLQRLFNSLKQETRIKVKEEYYRHFDAEIQRHPKPISYYIGEPAMDSTDYIHLFTQGLEQHKNLFEKYRYYFEPEKLVANGIHGNATMLYSFDYRFLYFFYKALDSVLEKE